ncbi:hypothetical protein X942_6603 [Burkholderia pseudomallei MSHR5596]|nr:hypothetical protein X942_6603 [Burkholderia pseudomallei MSHR5596]
MPGFRIAAIPLVARAVGVDGRRGARRTEGHVALGRDRAALAEVEPRTLRRQVTAHTDG